MCEDDEKKCAIYQYQSNKNKSIKSNEVKRSQMKSNHSNECLWKALLFIIIIYTVGRKVLINGQEPPRTDFLSDQ